MTNAQNPPRAGLLERDHTQCKFSCLSAPTELEVEQQQQGSDMDIPEQRETISIPIFKASKKLEWLTQDIRFDVFISYCPKDEWIKTCVVKPLSHSIKQCLPDASIYLREESHMVISAKVLGISQDDASVQALLSSRGKGIFIAVISPQYVQDAQCMKELDLSHTFIKHLHIIPVLISKQGGPKLDYSLFKSRYPNLPVTEEITVPDISLRFQHLIIAKLSSKIYTMRGQANSIGVNMGLSFFNGIYSEFENLNRHSLIFARIAMEGWGISDMDNLLERSSLFYVSVNVDRLINIVEGFKAKLDVTRLLESLNHYRDKWFGEWIRNDVR